jgi:hypothetical protein
MKFRHLVSIPAVFSLCTVASVAVAETSPASTKTVASPGAPAGALPPPQSSNDAPPPVAQAAVTTTGVTEQAGIGGTQAYGRAGVLELGGSFGFTGASNYTSLSINPTLGWFFIDNVEISAIVGVNYNKIADKSGTVLRLLLEPSFHLPLSQTAWAFLGVGAGVASVPNPAGDTTSGFALSPRLGANILVGRSGLFSPALFVDYTSGGSVSTPQGTVIAVNTAYGVQAGYTVMW